MLLELSTFRAPPAIRPGCGPPCSTALPPPTVLLCLRSSVLFERRAEKVSQSPHKTHCKHILLETNTGKERPQVFFPRSPARQVISVPKQRPARCLSFRAEKQHINDGSGFGCTSFTRFVKKERQIYGKTFKV